MLREFDVSYRSCPNAFLCLESDETLGQMLGLKCGHTLYGRRNVLVDLEQRILAEVLEILPPMEDADG